MAKSHKAEGREVAQKNKAVPKWVRSWRCKKISTIGCGALVLISQTAFSDAGRHDTFRPYVGTSLLFDSNFLRLSKYDNARDAVGKSTKSDFIKQLRAGFDIDWRFSRQQVLVKVDFNQHWFETFNELNYLGHGLLSQWNWELGKNFKGDLGYLETKTLGTFNNINRLINNLLTLKKYYADGAYQISPNWFLHGGFSRNDLTFSDEARRIGNLREDTVNIGLRYLNPINNMLGVNATLSDGLYPKRIFTSDSLIDNAYTRSEYYLEWAWNYSVKTRIDGQIGYTLQEYDHLKARNFSAVTSQVKLYWEPTEKTDLLLSGWREITQANNITSSFVLSQGLKLIPSWSVSPKVKLKIPMSYEKRDYLGDPGIIDNDSTGQKDNITDIGLNLNYKPFENAELSAFIKNETRDSTLTRRTYRTHFGGLNIRVAF